MTPTRGYYSLIQFCPDPSRAEAANVGVLLFCPERQFIGAVTAPGNDRVRRFFKDRAFDLERVNATKKAIEDRLRGSAGEFKTLTDLEQFIATRANEIVITAPRPVKVLEPEDELQKLFDELVGGRRPRGTPVRPFIQRLGEALRRPEFNHRVECNKQITLPVVNREVTIPYAYRNGQLNLVQTQELSPLPSKAANMVLQLAGEGELINRHGIGGGPANLVVVYGFKREVDDPSLPDKIGALFADFKIRAVPEAGLDEFVAEVDQEAHV